MPLSPGQRVGAYEIVSQLGAGGMGEVYRARDSKLKRDVAIKVLPDDVAADRERLARFQREAEVLASLNHAHIAHVYGIEENALVMELVEGEDLSMRIRRGPIPLDEALPIAKQIAEALEAAHAMNVVHRDLKPGNVKVKDDGTVKVLDFGLAKAMDQGSGIRAQGSDTSVTLAMTVHGAILGTPAYMSPEQAKGKPVDQRTDIWAFGCVLYEMLTGQAAFRGETSTDIMAAVVTANPDWTLVDPAIPARIKRLLERCLTKDPKARLRDIGEARILIDEDDLPTTMIAPPVVTGMRVPKMLPWITAAIAVIAAAVIAVTRLRTSTPAPLSLRFVEPVASTPTGPSAVLSPDGSFLVYLTDSIQVRTLSELETREVPGTKNAVAPFISPDSRWIGFYADGKIKKIAVGGKEAVVITDASGDSGGATFVSNDRIVFSPGWYRSPLKSVSADGGTVAQVSTLNEAAGERGHWFPRALPDGQHVLFTIWYASTGLSTAKIGVLDLANGTHKVLGPGAMAQYANGHLLYFESGEYHLVPFDAKTQTITGEAKTVLQDALSLDPTGEDNIPVSLSASGAIAYWPGERYPQMAFTWIDRNGQSTPTPIKSETEGVSLSPDDRLVAVGRPQGGSSKIWIFDFTGNGQPLPGDGSNWGPEWNPDSKRVTFTTIRTGQYDVATQAIDGPQQVVLDGETDEDVLGWLADGRMIVREWKADTSVDLVDAARKQRAPLVTGDFDKSAGRPSPDGRWLALCADPSETPALYVRAIAGNGTLQRIADASAQCDVRWSSASKQLAFLRGNALIALPYDERDGTFIVGKETTITTLPPGSELYGITRDGGRLLIGVPPPVAVPITGIRVIVDGIARLAQ